MPSHYCKCGHCTMDSSSAGYYEHYLVKTKVQVWNQIISIYSQGLEKLLNMKKANTPEEGKILEKVRTELENMITNMKSEYIDFSIKK
jgi:hypothetical protein